MKSRLCAHNDALWYLCKWSICQTFQIGLIINKKTNKKTTNKHKKQLRFVYFKHEPLGEYF